MDRLRQILTATDPTKRAYTSADISTRTLDYWGWIDEVTDKHITGWVAARDSSLQLIEVELTHGEAALARAVAQHERPDIAKALGRPVKAGFEIKLSSLAYMNRSQLDELVDAPLTIRVRGSNRFLGPGPVQLSQQAVREVGEDAGHILETIRLTRELVAKGVSDAARRSPPTSTMAIAFYLPQFHAIEANDEWWGEGFTEWSNVTQARGFFPGHEQPRLPADLGYYDLRLRGTFAKQVELARRYGVGGFCMYVYSFDGHRLLNEPIDRLLEDPEPDFPYCLCWANEHWSRRWDGTNTEVLVEQGHTVEADVAFLDQVLPHFADPRYIRVEGAPLLVVYRASLLSNPGHVTNQWRQKARDAGHPGLYLVMAQTFGDTDPRSLGFDAALEFPPHGLEAREISGEVPGLSDEFAGYIFDYRDAIEDSLTRSRPEYLRIRGVMPGWDNTARRDAEGTLYFGSSPELYGAWTAGALAQSEPLPDGKRYLFINAWNEWAEGAYLEPDVHAGRAYLEATRAALAGTSPAGSLLAALRSIDPDDKQGVKSLALALEASFDAAQHSLASIRGMYAQRRDGSDAVRFLPGVPESFQGLRPAIGAQLWIDHLAHYQELSAAVIPRDSRPLISGWSVCQGVKQTYNTVSLMVLESISTDRVYSAFLHRRQPRPDVAAALEGSLASDEVGFAGFSATADLSGVAEGAYMLSVLYPTAEQALFGRVEGVVHVC